MKKPFDLRLIKRIIKKASPDALKSYFCYKNTLEDIDFSIIFDQSNTKEIYFHNIQKVLENIEDNLKAQILNDFEKVNFFAKSNNDNIASLINYIIYMQDLDLNYLNEYCNYEKALYILINFTKDFYTFYNVRSLLEYNSKFWLTRQDYYNSSALSNEIDLYKHLETLKPEVQKIFKKELRGKECQGEIVEFEDKIYIFFYLQDYPNCISTFNGEIIEETRFNPVFETIFIIDKRIKTVSIYADSIDKRSELHQVIGSTIFNQSNTSLHCKNKDVFDIQIIFNELVTNKKFIIPLSYGSFIKDIYINKLTLINNYENYSEITFDTKQNNKKHSDNQEDIIFKLLSEQKDFSKPMKYRAKSIQFIAIIENSHVSKMIKKQVNIYKTGLSNLGFEEIDEQIKNCFRSAGIIKKVED